MNTHKDYDIHFRYRWGKKEDVFNAAKELEVAMQIPNEARFTVYLK